MEQFGAGSRADGVKTIPKSPLELVGSHGQEGYAVTTIFPRVETSGS